jgi:hypothetical protein
MAPPSPYAIPAQGSLGIGLLVGFFGGCIGIALIHMLAKGADTKKGANIGFGVAVLLGLLGHVIRTLAH